MPKNPLHDIAIIATYNTQQQRRFNDRTELSLLQEVIAALLTETELKLADIDGINISSSTWNLRPREAIAWLNGAPRWCGNEFMGIAAVLEAAGAIATGQASMVMIASSQAGEYSDASATAPWTRPSHEFVECFGLYTAAEFALCAQRHMALYGTTPESLATVAATIRNHGNQHPKAAFFDKGVVSSNDVLESRMIASPFHLLDCCITSEGAAGLIITTAERARELDVKPVFILGAGSDRQAMSYTRAPVWDTYGEVGRRAASNAFKQAGLSPTDVDVCEFYDPFSFEVIRQFETFGFCKTGEGGEFVLNGRIAIDGEYPVATNGGLLSFGHAGTIQMLQKVIASCEQLTQRAPDALQVANPSIAMASNGGSGAAFTDVMLLGKDAL